MPAICGVNPEALRMFQVIERGEERKAVHSQGDLDYMLRRGWRKVATDTTIAPSEPVAEDAPRAKRKYTRRAPR